MEFLVIKGGEVFGTFSLAEIALFLEAGQLSPTDFVRVSNKDIPLSSIPELRDRGAKHAPSQPQLSPVQPSAPRRRSKSDVARLQIYGAIKDTIRSEVEAFLRPFQPDTPASMGLQALRTTDFLVSFPGAANTFTDHCCQKLIKIIRSASLVSSVRETSTPDLAKRIREMAFRPLDEILGRCGSYARQVRVIDMNIQNIKEELDKQANGTGASAWSEEAKGSEENGPKQPEWATPERMDQESAHLAQLKLAALLKIKDYCEAMQRLPETLLSYASDKCFAAETDFDFEREEAAQLKTLLQPKIIQAIETFDQVAALQKDDFTHQQQILSRTEEQKLVSGALNQASEERQRHKLKSAQQFRKLVLQVLVISLVLVVLLVFFWKLASR